MVKTNTPLLSFGAQGSIGGVLTTQRRGSATLVRSKPTPAYRYTLPQAYQRWLYEDYAYLWRQQSAATKALYRSAGVRFHLTAFQYWMKYQLTNLPDMVAWYKLDDPDGTTTKDSSRQGQDLTIVGASPATGRIDRCLSFDGINDYCHSFTVPPLTSFTIECFLTVATLPFATFHTLSGTWDGVTNSFGIDGWNARSTIYISIAAAGGNTICESTNIPATDTIYHYCFRYNGVTLDLFRDGVLDASVPAALGAILNLPRPMYIGWQPALGNKGWKGLIDNWILRNRALDDTEILRHSGRRYPL